MSLCIADNFTCNDANRPVTDRDVVLVAEGFDVLEELGCVIIPLRSATEVRNTVNG